MRRKVGPYREVTVIDVTRLGGEVCIFAVEDVPLMPHISGSLFKPWAVKVRTMRTEVGPILVFDNGATPPYSRGCVRIETDEDTIEKIKDGRLPIPKMPVAQPREFIVGSGRPFRRPSDSGAAEIFVEMYVAPGTRVLY